MFLRTFAAAAAFTIMAGGMAMADPIEGNWRTQSGETAAIGSCGGSYCITLKSGKHSGKRIGQMKASGGGKYTGSITDPADDKTYKGSATVSGSKMNMKGCVLAVLCRSQSWTKL